MLRGPLRCDADVRTVCRRFSTAAVVAKATFKDGFFEAKIKTTRTGFEGSFWLQGDAVEINVVAFTTGFSGGSEVERFNSQYYCFGNPALKGRAMCVRGSARRRQMPTANCQLPTAAVIVGFQLYTNVSGNVDER